MTVKNNIHHSTCYGHEAHENPLEKQEAFEIAVFALFLFCAELHENDDISFDNSLEPHEKHIILLIKSDENSNSSKQFPHFLHSNSNIGIYNFLSRHVT